MGAAIPISGGKKCGVFVLATMGVLIGVLSRRLIVGTSLVLGVAGNVVNWPSVTFRLLGGLPRNLPIDEFPLLGQAEETAGPCRRFDLDLFGVTADWDPSFQRLLRFKEGVIADCGYADIGV